MNAIARLYDEVMSGIAKPLSDSFSVRGIEHKIMGGITSQLRAHLPAGISYKGPVIESCVDGDRVVITAKVVVIGIKPTALEAMAQAIKDANK